MHTIANCCTLLMQNDAHFDVPYNGADNNDYVDGKGFSEKDGSLKSAMMKAASLKDNFQQGDSYEQYQYFYHPGHLGSSSFITNTDGEVVQHIEYVPYGEVFIEERNNVWNTPYLFNAKEFDEETGLYYYGARYYDSRLSMWYGVDALAEKYPNMSPYNYCVGNPVKFVDPDGNKNKGFKIVNGNVTITKSASKDAIKIYNTMSKTTIGLKAFKSMILVPTKIKIVVEDSDTDYMGLTVGSNNVTKEGYYKRATVHINLNSINSVGSRFEYEEEGVIATGVHESIHTTDLEQISIDRNRDIDADDNNRSLYWENETKPMNAEYDAISEYREEMQLDNTKWKEIYESDKDSKGYSKPVFRGNNNQD